MYCRRRAAYFRKEIAYYTLRLINKKVEKDCPGKDD